MTGFLGRFGITTKNDHDWRGIYNETSFLDEDAIEQRILSLSNTLISTEGDWSDWVSTFAFEATDFTKLREHISPNTATSSSLEERPDLRAAYQAYYGVLASAIDEHGVYSASSEWPPAGGLCYAALVDFDNNGISELFYIIG
jgi:hypothetical protein